MSVLTVCTVLEQIFKRYYQHSLITFYVFISAHNYNSCISLVVVTEVMMPYLLCIFLYAKSAGFAFVWVA